MTKDQANNILDRHKHGTYRYTDNIITQALQCTGDLPKCTAMVITVDVEAGVARLGLGLRQEFEQERHIGAVRRARSRTMDFV